MNPTKEEIEDALMIADNEMIRFPDIRYDNALPILAAAYREAMAELHKRNTELNNIYYAIDEKLRPDQ